jgi:hypothetical protein
VVLGNVIQIIFDICLELSLDTTSKPTLLDKMQDPELYDDE